MSTKVDISLYRPNVAAIVVCDGDILLCEREDIAGMWQLPQGGIDDGEEPVQAVIREVYEEINVRKEQYEILCEYPGWLIYQWPEDFKVPEHLKMWKGQRQKYFLLSLKSKTDVDIIKASSDEFQNLKWVRKEDYFKSEFRFKREVYLKALEYFLEDYQDYFK